VSLKDVLAHVDADELVELTRELVRRPSVVRPGDPSATESAVADYVHRWFVKEGFDAEVHEVAPGRPNVLAVLGEKGSGKSMTEVPTFSRRVWAATAVATISGEGRKPSLS